MSEWQVSRDRIGALYTIDALRAENVELKSRLTRAEARIAALRNELRKTQAYVDSRNQMAIEDVLAADDKLARYPQEKP